MTVTTTAPLLSPSDVDTVIVTVTPNGFNPQDITIDPGMTVLWYNPGTQPLELASDSSKITGVVAAGGTLEVTDLASVGYYLKNSRNITGTINVS